MPSLAIRVHEKVFKDGMNGLLNGSLDLMVGPIGVYRLSKVSKNSG